MILFGGATATANKAWDPAACLRFFRLWECATAVVWRPALLAGRKVDRPIIFLITWQFDNSLKYFPNHNEKHYLPCHSPLHLSSTFPFHCNYTCQFIIRNTHNTRGFVLYRHHFSTDNAKYSTYITAAVARCFTQNDSSVTNKRTQHIVLKSNPYFAGKWLNCYATACIPLSLPFE